MADFKDNLAMIRKEHGLSQQQLAAELSRISRRNYTRSAVSLWEGGQRTPGRGTLELLADYFQVDLNWLLGRDTDTPPGFPEITMIARAGEKMSPERRADMLRLLKIAFPEEFN